jgi:hypothetical protein
MKYSRILAAFQATPWAILPEKFAAILSFLQINADCGEMTAQEIALIKKPIREPV